MGGFRSKITQHILFNSTLKVLDFYLLIPNWPLIFLLSF